MLDIDKQENKTHEVTNKSLLEQKIDNVPFLARYEEESSEVDDFYCGNTSKIHKELDKIEKEFNQNMDSDSSESDE